MNFPKQPETLFTDTIQLNKSSLSWLYWEALFSLSSFQYMAPDVSLAFCGLFLPSLVPDSLWLFMMDLLEGWVLKAQADMRLQAPIWPPGTPNPGLKRRSPSITFATKHKQK